MIATRPAPLAITDYAEESSRRVGGRTASANSCRRKRAGRMCDPSTPMVREGTLALVGQTDRQVHAGVALARLLPAPRERSSSTATTSCDLPLDMIRRTIGFAQQDSFLFSTTVARNIVFPSTTPTRSRRRRPFARARDRGRCWKRRSRFRTDSTPSSGERGVHSADRNSASALARSLMWQPKVLVLTNPISARPTRARGPILDTIQRRSRASHGSAHHPPGRGWPRAATGGRARCRAVSRWAHDELVLARTLRPLRGRAALEGRDRDPGRDRSGAVERRRPVRRTARWVRHDGGSETRRPDSRRVPACRGHEEVLARNFTKRRHRQGYDASSCASSGVSRAHGASSMFRSACCW